MQRTWAVLTAGLIYVSTLSADAAHTRATLILSANTAKPGDSILAGVRLQMDPGWHTYWKNPGDSGAATKIKWQLPPGVTAGEIQWPLPEKFTASDLTTYVHHGEVVLLIPLTFAADLKPGPLDLKAKVEWLECEEVCIKGTTNVESRVQIGSETQPATEAALLETWKTKLPQSATSLSVHASWEKPANGDTRAVILEWNAAGPAKEADFFPFAGNNFEVQAAVEKLSDTPGKIRLRKLVKKFDGDWPAKLNGVLMQKADGAPQGFTVQIEVGDSTAKSSVHTMPTGNVPPTPLAAIAAPTDSFVRMLLYAFIGGLILNIMPCVFPVIGLKILGFVQQSHDEPRRVFRLGLVYGLGVMVSFLIMAGIVIAIQQAGGSASWGMQFKNPQISVGFIVLVILIALNLFGVFEVNLGGRTLATAGNLTSKHGPAGAFFNGVLATALATPCTAPVLASALGFAFSKPPLVILLFFLTIGLGLAFPYVLLSWKPGWLNFLPRPGRWMERFKIAMGFPMLATGVWIFWFTAPRFGDGGILWVGWFLIVVALAAWIWGEFVQRGNKGRTLATAICLLLIIAGYAITLEKKLQWRSPVKPTTSGELQNEPTGVQWKKWSVAAVEQARSQARPILVDFTAKWCPTCNAFVKPAVDNREVRKKLDEINGVALLADYTEYPDDMTTELKKFRNDGAVPLVLVYPRDASKPPEVLPTIPTRSEILAALEKAAK